MSKKVEFLGFFWYNITHMIITKHGESFLKFVYADKTIAFNPISKNSKQKTTKFGSDIAISCLYHPDFNGYDQVSYKDKVPFTIKGAGEYEISDVFIKGYGLKQKFQKADEMITSYSILFDEINLVVIGPISKAEDFSNEAYEEFNKGDIFIVPIGGEETFTPKEAAKFVKQFSPKVVIPIFYSSKDQLKEFSAELGSELKTEEKLTIKKKDLPEEGKKELIELKTI